MGQRRIVRELHDDLIDIKVSGPSPHDVAPEFGSDEEREQFEAFERVMAGEPPAES